MKKLLAIYLIITALLALITQATLWFLFPHLQHPVFYITLILVLCVSAGFQYILHLLKNKKQTQYNNAFIAGSSAKLLIYIVYAAICFYLLRPIAIAIGVHLMGVYLVFAFTETFFLLSSQKNKTGMQ